MPIAKGVLVNWGVTKTLGQYMGTVRLRTWAGPETTVAGAMTATCFQGHEEAYGQRSSGKVSYWSAPEDPPSSFQA